MPIFERAILTDGGAGSDIQDSDGPQAAARVGMDLMKNSKPALDAVVHTVRYLEDDPRFNAGLGSQLRADGCTVQLDAACMTSSGEFGAVACVEKKMRPKEAAQKAITLFDDAVDVGLIVLTPNEFASIARNGMAWLHLTETESLWH